MKGQLNLDPLYHAPVFRSMGHLRAGLLGVTTLATLTAAYISSGILSVQKVLYILYIKLLY